MTAFFVGVFIGFLMCIPIGPINVLVVNTQVKHNIVRALSIAIGGSLMDIVYFFLILSGLSLFELTENTTEVLKTLGLVFIFLIGVKELLNKKIEMTTLTEKDSPNGILKGLLLGIVIYTSNPTLVLTMTGLGSFVKSLSLFEFNQINILAISLGLGIGSFLWFLFLVKIVEKYKETLRNKYLYKLSKVSGALMIGLSLFMGQRLYF